MIVSLLRVKGIAQQYKEPISLMLIFLAYLFYFRGTFIGAHDLLTGDIEHWYGVSAHFLNGFYNGVLPLWNPYSQGGESFFPYFGLFRLLDPIHLILVGIGSLFHIKLTSYNYNHLLLEICAPEDRFVVYRDGYTNDWKTSIDGRKGTTRRVDINSKGVFVSKGKHLLEFSYTPTYFVISVWSYLTVCFLIFPLFILFFHIKGIRRLDASSEP